ncbi:MAG: alpha/beta hydrolase fold domain-containing protein [Clostridia bacterium]|nr:alpha/beta hydrolase fold domain-containing protein [Clostridia bacterium]
MSISVKFLRAQLSLFKPFVNDSSLEFARKSQDKIGELMTAVRHGDVTITENKPDKYESAWICPKDELRDGVILYLHGGGYTCGSLEYCKGFGSVLASELGMRVLCVAYRLAPENRFPASLDDAFSAYMALIACGISSSKIILCGESAGGGLIFSLCLKLKSLGMHLPAGLIAVSPWTDLAATGKSYEFNAEKDPSMSRERLSFFADCYSDDRTDPLVSPLYGDLSDMPPSLIFVGGSEIMLDDARQMHDKLVASGCASTLTVAPGLWHAYLLYNLKERRQDFALMDSFVRRTLKTERKLRWMRLDNAGKIYPAARRRSWTNMYRVSATLNEKIDPAVLQSALDITVRRFPSIAVRVRTGAFWYYLEEVPTAPMVAPDKYQPLVHLPFAAIGKCAFRVLYYENRIAVELFHALTDGNGAMTFLKTLVAEYLQQKYSVFVPCKCGVLSRTEPPSADELEDSFLKYTGDIAKSRSEKTAYKLPGTPEPDGFMHVTTFMANAEDVHRLARDNGVTVNTIIIAAFMKAILEIQSERIVSRQRRKPVKILVPVNLRRVFGSKTLRNFAMFVTPEVDARYGDYTFEELCKTVHHQIGFMVTPKEMAARICPNVKGETAFILKIMPLFIKNIAMRIIYDAVAEKKSCICVSNLGRIDVPPVMSDYVKRMDFVLGVQATCPCNCGILTYGDTLYMNLVRDTKEPVLERKFYEVMRGLDIKIKVESNER